MPASGLTQVNMLLTTSTTLGGQRRQKAAPERLPEVGLSFVQLTVLHIAAAFPVKSTSALALLDKLQCTVGPADRPCWTTAGFWTSLAGRWRKCELWHLATIISVSSNIVHVGKGRNGHQRDSCIPSISTITCRLQTSDICINSKKNSRRILQVAGLCKLVKLCLHVSA